MVPNHRRVSQPISRRRLIAAGGLVLSVLAVGTEQGCSRDSATPQGGATPQGDATPQASAAPPKRSAVGQSQGGHSITAVQLGGDRRRVLVLGGQHGAPEANTVNLADAVLGHFTRHESEIPKGVGLDVITVANPDGFIAGSRQYLSGVDPNRNWASGDWEADAYDSLGRFQPGLGGPTPMSEPETRQLASWISRRRPALVVNYHSAGGFVSTSQNGLSWELANVYADAAGYPCYGPDGSPFGYEITGAMDGWLAERGIADIVVELTTYEHPETEENIAGLTAVLARLAS